VSILPTADAEEQIALFYACDAEFLAIHVDFECSHRGHNLNLICPAWGWWRMREKLAFHK
jgi:hypothetical protein